MAAVVVAVVAAGALAGCSSSATAAATVRQLTLVSATDNAGQISLEGQGPVLMELGPKALSGSTDCTTFSARVSGSPEETTIDTMRGRTLGCDGDRQRWDARLLTTMWQADALDLGTTVVMTGPDGVRLEFAELPPIPASQLTGAHWDLVSTYQYGQAAVPRVSAGWLSLNAGAVTGNTGCRDITGSYTVTDDGLIDATVTPVGECDVDTARGQDNRFLMTFNDPDYIVETGDLVLISNGLRGLLLNPAA